MVAPPSTPPPPPDPPRKLPSSPSNHNLTPVQEEHEAFKNRLVEEVLGNTDNVIPMEKVIMLIWSFRENPNVVHFMARFITKYATTKDVFDGIEFYLPQLAHMIIHLEVDWDDEVLQRFGLSIAQQSIHFALQLNYILQGALDDYQPENQDGTPNDNYHPQFYTRTLKLLRNLELCVVYGTPRVPELQKLYQDSKISKQELEELESADRRFQALQITTRNDQKLDGWFWLAFDNQPKEMRYGILECGVLNLYNQQQVCGPGGIQLERGIPVVHSSVSLENNSLKIKTKHYILRLFLENTQERTLWYRRLQDHTTEFGIFHEPQFRNDLTEAQKERYDLYYNERQFVNAITQVAEDLRHVPRENRKAQAPDYVRKLDIPEYGYLPLCNSSDIWRRTSKCLPEHSRVFNTKERCPVILHFVSQRGETVQNQVLDSNLDVAEFLSLFGQEELPTIQEEEEDKDMKVSEHSVWTTDEPEETPVLTTPSAKGNQKVQRFLRESVVTLPNILSKRLGSGMRRSISVVDRQTTLQSSVPIVQGEGHANATFDGHVVSVQRSSVLVKNQILYGGLDEGGIDLESMDRAKEIVCGGTSWAEKSAQMLQGHSIEGGNLEISSCMAKSNDDLRQEVFVMQMIHYYKSLFAKSNLPLYLKTYRILSTSSSEGLIEVLTDATSLDGLKKSEGYPGSLRAYFEQVYGGPDSKAFKVAQTNFMQSLAGYALVGYLLGLKDRHNGNIMIDTRGHLIFIDFGFAFGMAPGHEFSFERAPFKLTKEYVDVMGGTKSECYKEFERLFVAGFEECRKNSQIALGLVEIMMYQSNYPCFSGSRYGNGRALAKFEQRLMLRVPDKRVKKRAKRLIRKAKQHFGTHMYDVFQKATNGYAI